MGGFTVGRIRKKSRRRYLPCLQCFNCSENKAAESMREEIAWRRSVRGSNATRRHASETTTSRQVAPVDLATLKLRSAN